MKNVKIRSAAGNKVCCVGTMDDNGKILAKGLCGRCLDLVEEAGYDVFPDGGTMPNEQQRAINSAMKDATPRKAQMRAACEENHTPEQLADRHLAMGKILAGMPGLFDVAEMEKWPCSFLRKTAQVAEMAKPTKAWKARTTTSTKTSTEQPLRDLPPIVRAAVEASQDDLESEHAMISALAQGRVRRAAHEALREEGRDLRQEAADEAKFQAAREQLDSSSAAVRELAYKNLQRLQAGPGQTREELIASLRGSAVRKHVADEDLADCSMDSLRRLVKDRDTLAGAGWTIGAVKSTARTARADRKRLARRNG